MNYKQKQFIRRSVVAAPQQKDFPRFVLWVILLVAVGVVIGNLFN